MVSSCCPRHSRVFSSTTVRKHQFFYPQPSLWPKSFIRTWLLDKPALIIWAFVGKVISLLFNTPSRFVIAYISFGFPGGSVVKNLPTNTGDVESTPGSGRSLGGGNGNPLQYFCLGNPMELDGLQCIKSQKGWHYWMTKQQQLNYRYFLLCNYSVLEDFMFLEVYLFF